MRGIRLLYVLSCLLALAGCASRKPVSTQVPNAPAAQGSLTASVKSASTTSTASASLNCNSGGSNEVAFNFYRQATTATTVSGCPASTGYVLLGTSPMVPTCSYTDATVVDGTNYCYVATGLNIAVSSTCPTGAKCESSFSSPAIALIPQALLPPTGLAVTSVTASNVTLQWSAPGKQTVAYRVYRKPVTAKVYSPLAYAVTSTNYKDSPGKGNFDYEVMAVYVVNGARIASVPSNVAVVSVP